MEWSRAEEVISTIGCCIAQYDKIHCSSDECEKCLYYIDRKKVSIEDEIMAYKMASEALHLHTIRQAVMKITVNCPTCGEELDLTQTNKICPHCGQWLDYSREFLDQPDLTITMKGERV